MCIPDGKFQFIVILYGCETYLLMLCTFVCVAVGGNRRLQVASMGVYEGLTQIKPGMHWVSETYNNYTEIHFTAYSNAMNGISRLINIDA